MSSLGKCLLSSAHFFNQAVCSRPLDWIGSLSNLDITPFSGIWFADTTSRSAGSPLVLLVISFTVQKHVVPLFIFAFVAFPYSCCSVTQSCPTLRNPMDCSTPGFPVLHYLLEFAETHVHWVSVAYQSTHPRSPPSPLTLNLPQLEGLFQWVGSSNQVVKVLELQFQHQSFQWIFRVDCL